VEGLRRGRGGDAVLRHGAALGRGARPHPRAGGATRARARGPHAARAARSCTST
jgi:hypothetical protein